jgi:hypothetical protein
VTCHCKDSVALQSDEHITISVCSDDNDGDEQAIETCAKMAPECRRPIPEDARKCSPFHGARTVHYRILHRAEELRQEDPDIFGSLEYLFDFDVAGLLLHRTERGNQIHV